MSSVASASEGITLVRKPPWMMVGTMEVRKHGVIARLMLGEIALDFFGVGGVRDVVIAIGLLGRADGGEPLEIGARGVVQSHGRLPALELCDGCRQVDHGIVQARPRAVASGSVRN